MTGLPHRPSRHIRPDNALPIRQVVKRSSSPKSMPAAPASQDTSQDSGRPYYDPFPTMANTPQGPAQQHLAWLHTNLFQRPNRYQTALAIIHSAKLSKPSLPSPDTDVPRSKMVIRLVQADTFSAARELRRLHPTDKIAVLNMANAIAPGGGFLQGGRAQEEDLCHCSSLFPSLRRQFYPLQDDELIYSPDILVVKQKDPAHAVGGRLMEEKDWFSVDVISCAAVSRPMTVPVQHIDSDNLTTSEDTYHNDRDRQTMKAKLSYIMHAAVQNRVQRLVLGAFGCGVFSNPVREVARMMKKMLIDSGNGDGPSTDWTRYGLSEVVIAIFDPLRFQPVFNGFMTEFREGGALHRPDGNNVAVPNSIQYTVFPPSYTGVKVPLEPDTTLSDDSLFATDGMNLSQMVQGP